MAWRPQVDYVEWTEGVVVIKAELCTLVPDSVCSPTPELRTAFDAPGTWWSTLHTALDTLAEQPTTRGNADLADYTADLEAFFDHTITAAQPSIATEHTDVHRANLTAPNLALLDWAYWGRATRGYAATLYCHALLVPDIATRLHTVFGDVLDTPSGRHAQLSVIRFMLHRVENGEYPDLAAPLRNLAGRLLNPTSRET